MAEFLFRGQRFGRHRIEDFDEEELEALEMTAGYFSRSDANIRYGGRLGGNFGHEFYLADPVVSSDLVLMLRFGRDPGPGHGRPLTHLGSLLWDIDPDYFERQGD